MITLILTCFMLCVLVDFVVVGFSPSLFGIWKRYAKLDVKEEYFKDVLIWARTDIEGRNIDNMINSRAGYKYVLLTDKGVIFKNTILTYLLFVDVLNIQRCEIVKKLGVLRVLNFSVNIDGVERSLKICPTKPSQWIKHLETMGVEVK